MSTKAFDDKKIIIRKIRKAYKNNAKKFLTFINSLVAEDAPILINKKTTLAEETTYINRINQEIRNKQRVHILAEYNNKIIGHVSIEMKKYREGHIGEIALWILNSYRQIGLEKYLISGIINLAKKEIKPKIIQLEVCESNLPDVNLFKELGFKIVAKVPDQIHWKRKFLIKYIMLKHL